MSLSFLLLIGVNLMAEALDLHIPKGYTYFAMGFAIAVELLNLRLRRTQSAAQQVAEAQVVQQAASRSDQQHKFNRPL